MKRRVPMVHLHQPPSRLWHTPWQTMPMMPYVFDNATHGELSGSRYHTHLHPEWNIDGRILNGGYLQAVAVRAASSILEPALDPVAVSTIFLTTPAPGEAHIDLEVLRQGQRLTAVNADIIQGDRHILRTVVSYGHIAEPVPGRPAAPQSPATSSFTDSVAVPVAQLPGPPGLGECVTYRLAPESAGWLQGDFSAGPTMLWWLEFSDQRPVDLLAACALVDMAPPAGFAIGMFGWAPTVHLQVGLYGEPAPGPVLLELNGSPYHGTVVGENARLWDSDGVLIAQSRQVALAPPTR